MQTIAIPKMENTLGVYHIFVHNNIGYYRTGASIELTCTKLADALHTTMVFGKDTISCVELRQLCQGPNIDASLYMIKNHLNEGSILATKGVFYKGNRVDHVCLTQLLLDFKITYNMQYCVYMT